VDAAPKREKELTMPLYEFKCLKCNEFFELLVMKQGEEVTMKCPQCSSSEFERVLSKTGYAMGAKGAGNKGVSTQSRTCSSGSCTTYTIPGPNG
jgi:putative FmdB family regulatory protein